jgi:hypothetical protein
MKDALAYFENFQSIELALARSLGIIAIEMMQNGISLMTDEKLVLKNHGRWSPEASNFRHRFMGYTKRDA